MRRAFTLVELLAVIVILAIILSLAIPTMIGIISKSKDNTYNTQIDNIISATKFYISDNGNNISALNTVGGVYYVPLSELNTNGYLELPITNPKTGSIFDANNSWVIVTKTFVRAYTYEFTLQAQPIDTTAPTVVFGTNGNSIYAKTKSTTVTVADINLKTSSLKYLWTTSTTAPTEASFSTIFTNGVTMNTPSGVTGTYYLWILAKDIAGNTAITNSNVFKLDNIVPVITMLGTSTVTIATGSTYTDLGATATDNIDGTLTSSITATSTVVPTVVGTYTVTYNVSDVSGNAASAVVRTVIVKNQLDTSGASIPQISSNMIPIYYDGTVWRKADVNNSSSTYQWYDYTNKKWANAVTVTAATRSTYQSAAVGTTVAETDILTYMVWIPRYKYRISTGGTVTPSSTDIVFESAGTTKSVGNATTTYLTHPAFTFGGTELNGIWVAKFETAGTISAIAVKPNISSLCSQSVSSFYTAFKNMKASGNAYGYVTSEVDTHLMLNSEWGTVAYLSNSIYGFNQEVWINNSSTSTTGCAGASVSANSYAGCANAYNTTTGGYASTTGNIYGIYDMSGGAYDYVMGNYNSESGYETSINSGFSGYNGHDGTTTVGLAFPTSQYYNLYTTITPTTACSGGICYGQALSETSGWNSDFANFVIVTTPWLARGGLYGSSTAAGLFSFSNYYGEAYSGYSTRLVQTKL